MAPSGGESGQHVDAAAAGQRPDSAPLNSPAGNQASERLRLAAPPAASQQHEQRRPPTHSDVRVAQRFAGAFERASAERSQLWQPNETLASSVALSEAAPLGQHQATLNTTGLPLEQPHAPHDADLHGRECFDDPASASITSFIHCNSTANSQLLLMNISTQDLNFGSVNEVWLLKSCQEILLRVSLVAPIVLLGLLGNLTIIYWMCRFKPIRSRPTNIFILNMALADLLTSIFVPNAALLTDIFQFYVLGAFMCRFEGFLKITCLLVSAYSLIVLSFDWFLCVVKPCRRRITIRQSWLTLAGIWIVSLVAASPLLYWRNLRERQWKDLVEVWCCEHIQYTKYYWVCITLFLIYLPTFIMTIVLVVILVQMDKFEAKLKRSRRPNAARSMSSAGISAGLTYAAPSASSASLASLGLPEGQSSLNSSLSISMKYRRRILKILSFYLLTSIVCWTPIQFVIIYRHFRAEAVPANWFFELAFWSQLCASLSAALNPIIFGFLSQPFRRIVTKSWMFRFCDKFCPRAPPRNKPNHDNGKPNQLAMVDRAADRQADKHQQHHHHNGLGRPNLNCARSSHRAAPNLEPPKLTLDYIEPQQMSGRIHTSASSSKRISTISGGQLTRHRSSRANQRHAHHRAHHQRRSHVDSASQSSSAMRDTRPKLDRSHSSRLRNVETENNELSASLNKRVSFHKRESSSRAALTNGATGGGGKENGAYLRDEPHLGDHEMEVRDKRPTSGPG